MNFDALKSLIGVSCKTNFDYNPLYLAGPAEPEAPPKIKTIEVHSVEAEAEVIFEAKVVSNTAEVAETVEAAEVADLITTVIGKNKFA